jgi:hypothetical protein
VHSNLKGTAEDTSPLNMPRQTTLDGFLARPAKRDKSTKANIKGPSASQIPVNDSIETVTPVSTPPVEAKPNRKTRGVDTKLKLVKPQLEVEETPRRFSPRLQIQRSKLIPKPTLLAVGEPSPARAAGTPTFAWPAVSPPDLSALRSSGTQLMRSPSKPRSTSTYQTAPTSPVQSSSNSDISQISTIHGVLPLTTEHTHSQNATHLQTREIPSSLPWENSPTEGYGDSWPSSQSESSPTRKSSTTSSQQSLTRFDNGFRVPAIPASKRSNSVDDTQDESQDRLSEHFGWMRTPSQSRNEDGFRVPELPNRPTTNVDDTQDSTQDEESPVVAPPTSRKRKREASSQNPTSSPTEDSCILLSQAPPHMRKPTPEVITIHSTQSQREEPLIPSPIPRHRGASSQNFPSQDSLGFRSSAHDWTSSQPTQPQVDPPKEIRATGPPSRSPVLFAQKVAEPLRMVLEYGYPGTRSYQRRVDLDELERQQDMELEKWDSEHEKSCPSHEKSRPSHEKSRPSHEIPYNP